MRAMARLGLLFLFVSTTAYPSVDTVVLRVEPGAVEGEVLLILDALTGELSQTEIYRADAPSSVVGPGNKIAETSGSEWTDAPSPISPLTFYVVTPACDPDCGAGQHCCNGVCVDPFVAQRVGSHRRCRDS